MVKTILFNSSGHPAKLEKGFKPQKGFYWAHVDQREDEGVADLIAYELSEYGISHDLRSNPRPSVRFSKKYEIIKLTFPREAGMMHNPHHNLVVRFVISKNSMITISNDSEELNHTMHEIYINKKKVPNVTELFVDIVNRLINRSYDALTHLDNTINAIQKSIFENVDKRGNFKRAEEIREHIYHLYMFLLANIEVFEQMRDENGTFLKYNHRVDHLRSRLTHLKDVLGGEKENLSHVSDLYLGMLSSNMSKYMYKITILAAILLVPTIIAGLYGMNIPLPEASFWTIVGVSAGLALSSGFFMSWWAKK